MKTFYVLLVGLCVLALSLTGCCRHGDRYSDGTCIKTMDIINPIPMQEQTLYPLPGEKGVSMREEAVVPVKKVVVIPAKAEPEPAPVEKAVVPEAKPAPVEEPLPVAKPAPVVEAAPVVQPVHVPETFPASGAYNFGDYRSSTLTTKAWQALAAKDYDAVYVYTNKCIDLYSAEAAKMQYELKDYPSGDPQKIFSYWAVNDVATCLYIQGEAYRRSRQMDKARVAFKRIGNEFFYGQAYDTGSKTFWRLVDGAEDSLYMIEKNLDLNYGNMSSNWLVLRMWESMAKKNLEEVIAYDRKLERLYRQTALDMQVPLSDYPALPAQNIHMYWAVNDVGTGMFILGEAYRNAGMPEEAAAAYKKVISDYYYAQCWDPQGWFWKPADAAQQKIMEIEAAQ